MTPPVMFRLDVEAMKYSIVHAFAAHSEDLQAIIEEEFDKALKAFDFKALVREAAATEIRKAVVSAVSHAASTVMWDKEIAAVLSTGAATLVRTAIKDALTKEYL